MSPERNPVRDEYSLFPMKKVRRTVKVPKRAEGNLTENGVTPCQRKDEMPLNQKKRGGLSVYSSPLRCMRIQSPPFTISLETSA
jgi:hypothetical protein